MKAAGETLLPSLPQSLANSAVNGGATGLPGAGVVTGGPQSLGSGGLSGGGGGVGGGHGSGMEMEKENELKRKSAKISSYYENLRSNVFSLLGKNSSL